MPQTDRVRSQAPRLGIALLLGGLLAVPLPIGTARAGTVDLIATVAASGQIVIGSIATSTVTVSNVGTDPTSGTTSATLLLPANANATGASGPGWNCALTSARRVDCASADSVAGGTSFPAISVTVTGTGTPLAGVQYAIVSGGGDTNAANDLAREVVRVVQPPSGADQMFVQLSGAFRLRVGGNVDSGSLAIGRDVFLGLSAITGTATIGTTTVTFNVRRQLWPTPWTGTVTVTDPAVQGGVPLAVPVKTGVSDGGSARQAWGSVNDMLVPSFAGAAGDLAKGLRFSLNWGVGDFSPTAPPGSSTLPLHRPSVAAALQLSLTPPPRIQTGQTRTVSAQVVANTGVTDGPVTIVANVPDGLAASGGGSNTTCEAAGSWQVCTLDSTVTAPIGKGDAVSGEIGLAASAGASTIPLTMRAEVPNDTIPSDGNQSSTALNVTSAGPDLAVAASGPEVTPALWFTQGGDPANAYEMTVTNTGSTASGPVTAVIALGAGLTYDSVAGSGWSCIVTSPPSEVTCSHAGLGTTALDRSSTATVRVSVDPAAAPSASTTFAVSSPGDVAPAASEKTATVATPAVPPNPATMSYSFSNGAATVSNLPVIAGGFSVFRNYLGGPTVISGCGTTRRFVPADGPYPSRVDEVKLCLNLRNQSRYLMVNYWYGTVQVHEVRGPVRLPAPVPPTVPPLGVPAPTMTNATLWFKFLSPFGPNTFGGRVSATNSQYLYSGGSGFVIDWSFTNPP